VRAGQVGVRAIAAQTGLAPSTVAEHLARLREAGALPADPTSAEAA
jgi:DNA-binding IclR family transcriptional regulator